MESQCCVNISVDFLLKLYMYIYIYKIYIINVVIYNHCNLWLDYWVKYKKRQYLDSAHKASKVGIVAFIW